MPATLVLKLAKSEFHVELKKIDRAKLYGEVEIEAVDEKGKPATLKLLASDGKTLIDTGGTALETLNEKGDSLHRDDLTPLNLDGEEIKEVPSSFDEPNKITKASIDDYLSLIVKSVYQLSPAPDHDLDKMFERLGKSEIFSFPFSYRAGLEYDRAFIIGNSEEAFMVVGKPAELEFVGFNQPAMLSPDEEEEIAADEIDFSLL